MQMTLHLLFLQFSLFFFLQKHNSCLKFKFHFPFQEMTTALAGDRNETFDESLRFAKTIQDFVVSLLEMNKFFFHLFVRRTKQLPRSGQVQS
jgi:hypothetical protein